MDFSSMASQAGGSNPKMPTEKFMDHFKSQMEQAYAQKFIELGGKCFDKCVTKPGSSLGGSESSCVSRCVDRYIEATGIVGRALFKANQ
ncbi:unnamed protein product [Linum tenue]|uniref:Mitochondrial import inner membrane translocase subunit n=1 Tax=Linum tenue TaxID=586396 RepID=A0AAV0M531_9ROSI|nr:unnamed protein product [Linum tenue]